VFAIKKMLGTEPNVNTLLLQKLFIGRALRDQHATIIHHFAFHENPSSFAYPDFMSCFLMTFALLQRLLSFCNNFFKPAVCTDVNCHT